MANFTSYGLIRKVGITDPNGKVVIEPVFDGIIIGDSVAFVKNNKKWGILTDVENKSYIEYNYEEVMGLEEVIWVRKDGDWGVLDYNGNVLIEPIYKAIWRMGDSEIVEAYDLKGAVHYIHNGLELSDEVELMGVLPFEMGYAMAFGCEKGSHINKYFVVREDDGGVLTKSFMYKSDCENWLRDLRESYVWSVQWRRNRPGQRACIR